MQQGARIWKAYTHWHIHCQLEKRSRLGPGRSGPGPGLRNCQWSECTITFVRVCAVSEVIRSLNMKTCIRSVCTLPAMAIDPIEEAADDLIVESGSDCE